MKESKLEASLIATKKTNQELEVNSLVIYGVQLSGTVLCIYVYNYTMYTRTHARTHTLTEKY